ncbi:MAG: putative flap endonuclease-1-like 5' DNA nuclease [Cryomorphaceae bacterium]|jgi:predicted flap endonuclease-1-like 5' DNA nuclease
MWYLFIQIWVWLLVAFALGWSTHWFLSSRGSDDEQGGKNEDSVGLSAGLAAADTRISDSWKPHGFASSPETVEDLKKIKGIVPVIEDTLNGLGIYHFAQIAQWSPDNVSWIENLLTFPGRIERESWIDQATTLEAGGTTEFAIRVDKGELDYD